MPLDALPPDSPKAAIPRAADRLTLAREIVADYEGLRTIAYRCPAGCWTIGYGHTKGVKPGDRITPGQAGILLDRDLRDFAAGVAALIRVPLGEPGHAACISFAYNIGLGAFEDSTLLFLLNQRRYAAAGEQFGRWTRAGGEILPGLARRRAAERQLFLAGIPAAPATQTAQAPK